MVNNSSRGGGGGGRGARRRVQTDLTFSGSDGDESTASRYASFFSGCGKRLSLSTSSIFGRNWFRGGAGASSGGGGPPGAGRGNGKIFSSKGTNSPVRLMSHESGRALSSAASTPRSGNSAPNSAREGGGARSGSGAPASSTLSSPSRSSTRAVGANKIAIQLALAKERVSYRVRDFRRKFSEMLLELEEEENSGGSSSWVGMVDLSNASVNVVGVGGAGQTADADAPEEDSPSNKSLRSKSREIDIDDEQPPSTSSAADEDESPSASGSSCSRGEAGAVTPPRSSSPTRRLMGVGAGFDGGDGSPPPTPGRRNATTHDLKPPPAAGTNGARPPRSRNQNKNGRRHLASNVGNGRPTSAFSRGKAPPRSCFWLLMRKAAIAARWVVWIAKKACCSKRSSRLLKVVFYTVCSAMLMYYAITLTGFVSPETLIATFEGGSYSTGAGKSGDEGEAKGGGSALLWGSSASSFWFQGGATASGREKGAEVGKASVGVGKMSGGAPSKVDKRRHEHDENSDASTTATAADATRTAAKAERPTKHPFFETTAGGGEAAATSTARQETQEHAHVDPGRFATEVGVVEKQKELLEVAPGTLASGEAEQGVIDETVVTSTIGGDEGVGAAATATAQPADPGGSTTGRLLARTKTTSTKPPSLASGASLTQQSGTALGDDQQDEHSALAPSDEDPHTHPAPVPEQQVRSQQDLEDGGDPLAPDQPPPEVVAVADEEQDGTGGTDNSGPRASGTTATAASAKGNLKGTGSSASPSPTPTGGGANAGERNSQSDSLLQSENGSKNAFGTTDDRDETERAAEQEAGDEGEGEGGAEEEELNAHPVRLHSVSMLVFLVLSVMLVLALSLWYAAKTKRCLLPRWMRNLWERKSGLSISLDREEMLEKNLSNPRAASHFESQGHPRDTSVHLIPPIKNIPPPSSAQIVSGRSNSKTKTSSRELGSCTSSTGGGPPPGGGAGGHQQGPAPPLPAAARATRTPSLSSTTTTTHTDGVGAGSMISVERTMRFGRYRRVGDVVLGHGSCKVVYLAENLETGERVAWSQIGMQDDEHGQAMRSSRALSVSSQLEQTKSELQLLIAATQPGVNDKLNPSVSDRSKILKLLDYSFDTEEATNYHSYGNPPETIRIHMITELHPGGCLRKWHYNITHNIHPESNELGFKFAGEMCRELKNCAISISQGLRYLHSTKIIHRDVRPDNIFVKVDRGGKIQDAVLADLGLFRFAREKEVVSNAAGPPSAPAPATNRSQSSASRRGGAVGISSCSTTVLTTPRGTTTPGVPAMVPLATSTASASYQHHGLATPTSVTATPTNINMPTPPGAASTGVFGAGPLPLSTGGPNRAPPAAGAQKKASKPLTPVGTPTPTPATARSTVSDTRPSVLDQILAPQLQQPTSPTPSNTPSNGTNVHAGVAGAPPPLPLLPGEQGGVSPIDHEISTATGGSSTGSAAGGANVHYGAALSGVVGGGTAPTPTMVAPPPSAVPLHPRTRSKSINRPPPLTRDDFSSASAIATDPFGGATATEPHSAPLIPTIGPGGLTPPGAAVAASAAPPPPAATTSSTSAVSASSGTPTPTFAGILHGSHAFLDPAPPPARQGQEHQPGTTPVDSASDREQETTSSAPGGGSQQPRQAYAAYATITTQEHRFTISGNDAYYPPEVIRQLIESPPNLMDFHAKIRCSFDSKLDIYMFGLSILEMFLDGRRRTFVRNYSDYDEFEDYVSAFEHEKSKILSEARHKYAEDQFSHMQLNHFLSNSLKSDPERRWTANDCFFGLTQAYLGFSALDRDGATPTEGTNHLHLPRGTRSSRDHGDRSSRGEPNSPVAGGLVGPEHTGRKESHDNSSTISCTPLPAGSTVGFDDLESEP